MIYAVVIIAICSAAGWLLQLYAIIRTIRAMPVLGDFNYSELHKYPLISVIITACNEAKTIEEAVTLRLQDDYPALEFILIDDRSTDGTSEIIDKMAAGDPRVKAIHIKELPEGWLGKVHALHQGIKEASGEWYLFSDADVQVEPGTLKQLIAHCEHKKLDHVAILPQFLSAGFFVDVAVSVFLRGLLAGGRSYKAEDEQSKVAVGAGAFNLVKRTAFAKTAGFPWLKLEIIDDITLGQMLKASGARNSAISGRGPVRVRWYSSFKELVGGLGRAAAVGIGNYSLLQLVLAGCLAFILDIIPFVILIPMGIPFLPFLGLFTVVTAVTVTILSNRLTGLPLLAAFFLPVGYVIVFFITLLGGLKLFKDKGIYWRDTFYPKKLLKKGRRFKFFP